MTRSPGAKAFAVAALALLVLSAVPVATADHAYSHRYIVYGRVVDANGDPVPGLTVDLGYEPPFDPEGACSNQPRTETDAFGPTRTTPITNDFGEFLFCFHTHGVSRTLPGAAVITIAGENVEERIEFDGFMRYSYAPIQLDRVHPQANTTVKDTTYTIFGRAWQESDQTTVEGVRVFGDTIYNKPATITFAYNGNPPVTLNTTTNAYGDFSIRVPVSSRPTGGEVTLSIENNTFTAPVDAVYGVTSFRAAVDKPKDPILGTFGIGALIVGAVVVGGGAIWYGATRLRSAREERLARERSTRKRANK